MARVPMTLPVTQMMAKKPLAVPSAAQSSANGISAAILGFIGKIPHTKKHKSREPAETSRRAASRAAAKAALTAGSLALPPGPLGWLTIIPELTAVWKIQAQLVADIAAIYGKDVSLTREHMLYCLFRHTTAHAFRDVVVRVGQRVLIRRASLRVLQTIAQKIGIRITQRVIGKGISRWLPVAGAVGVAAYAYYDTSQVAATTIALLEQELDIGPETNHE